MALTEDRKKEIEEEERLRAQVRKEIETKRRSEPIKIDPTLKKKLLICAALGLLGLIFVIASNMDQWSMERTAAKAERDNLSGRTLLEGK